MASARAALRVAVVVNKAAGPPAGAKAVTHEVSASVSAACRIETGTWRAFFYEFLEDCHVEVYCLQAKTLGTRAKVLIPTIKLGR